MRDTAVSPAVTVVAATHNRSVRLRALLDSLERQSVGTSRFDVVIVDDGSRDDTTEVLADAVQSSPLALRVLRQPESRGPAAARNRGWREAGGSVIAFTDDDCEPDTRWLEQLLAGADGPMTIVQGRTLPNPRETHRLGTFTRTLEVGGPSPHYPTANILYPRAVLERLDGFDEDYGAPAGEDTDLGWRAKGLGAETVFAADALVHHAVHERGPMNTLKDAFRATDCVKSYRDHPELKAHLDKGLFFHPSHPLLAEAVVAAVLARRTPAAAVFALPYALHLVRRARASGAPATAAPFLAVRDAVEVVATVRGALKYRVAVL